MIKENLIGAQGVLSPPPGTMWSDLPRQLQLEADRGNVRISNSWEDIARWMGAAPEVLKSTIDEYNSFCDRGHDAMFVKEPQYLLPLRTPPYYAVKCGGGFLMTMGGIKINHHMEVLNLEDDPIPGLYAVGNDAGGWQWDTYSQDLAGFALGFAVNSGRIVGENAAEYVSGR